MVVAGAGWLEVGLVGPGLQLLGGLLILLRLALFCVLSGNTQVPMLFDRLLQAPHVVSLDSPNPHLDVWWCRSVHHYRPLVSGCTSPPNCFQNRLRKISGDGDLRSIQARTMNPRL